MRQKVRTRVTVREREFIEGDIKTERERERER